MVPILRITHMMNYCLVELESSKKWEGSNERRWIDGKARNSVTLDGCFWRRPIDDHVDYRDKLVK